MEICEFGKGGDGAAEGVDVCDAWGKGGEKGILRGRSLRERDFGKLGKHYGNLKR